jgi:hypothetical protein
MPGSEIPRAPSAESADNGALRYNTNVAPKQDPSALTTQQLLRENFWLRELLETRLNGMDKAILLLQAFADRTPTTMDIQHEVTALRDLTLEKFEGIKTQFRERDARTEKTEKDSIKAVDAAFASADKAITKTENNFTKQFDEQGKRIEAAEKKSDEKNDDLKVRLTVIEARTQGMTQQKTESAVATTQNTSQVASIAGIVFGALMFFIALGSLAFAVINSHPTPAPQVLYAPVNPQAK